MRVTQWVHVVSPHGVDQSSNELDLANGQLADSLNLLTCLILSVQFGQMRLVENIF